MEMRVRAGDAAKFAMALSEVMDNSSNGSDRSGSRGGSTRSAIAASDAAADARMVFKADEGGNRQKHPTSVDHVVVGEGNVAYANHSVVRGAHGVRPPLAGSGGSMPGLPSRSNSQSSHVSLTVVNEDANSGGRASPGALGMTKDGEPFDPFEDANRT